MNFGFWTKIISLTSCFLLKFSLKLNHEFWLLDKNHKFDFMFLLKFSLKLNHKLWLLDKNHKFDFMFFIEIFSQIKS